MENKSKEQSSSVDFKEAIQSLGIKNEGVEVPSNLSGGILLDLSYGIAPQELNSILHSPDSKFLKSLRDIQGSIDVQIGPWKSENNGESLKRVISHTKPGGTFMKATKTTEEQTYLKADGKAFAILASVSIPDAPYGKSFKVELLVIITPAPEQSSRLVVSWRVNFLQSIMMKGMVESGVRQAMKELAEHYEKVLSRIVKPLDPVMMENNSKEQSSSVDFKETMKSFGIRNQGIEVPSNLTGGVLLDLSYGIAPQELNSILFSPDSNFLKSLRDIQGSIDVQIGPWKSENNGESLKRVISYTKPGSTFTKATKTTEEHIYLKADGKAFAVLASVSIPDAPYGKSFKLEVLVVTTPGPEQSSRLVISWRVNFLQSIMMKGMVESGVRQAMKELAEHYEKVLSQIVKPLDVKDKGTEKDKLLSSFKVERQPDWKLGIQFFANFTVISTIIVGLYVLRHIWLAMPSEVQGLEFVGLDLPDSIGEVIICGVLVLQGKRLLELMSRFMQARLQKGSDHGIKARGDGWMLTVALVGGSNLAAVDSSGFSYPYVVFACNRKTRTSSIKFQRYGPLWNEIFEFDAMDDAPSVLNVEVFDFDGPFEEATSLGHAEINFLKSNSSDLSDIWIPLQGKLAQACQSKLHLRIFLENSRGENVVKDYISKMEKEVGKKIRVRSARTNSAFQKLFGLPSEEFLINDFACHLKRRMPLQGRLFLSARIMGFHADLFGLQTKFFFLWEDIEDIKVIPPTLSSICSPIIITTLKPGRGSDARHGARTQDAKGRLKFHFHSFVSFNVAHRTIIALWRAKKELDNTNFEQ